ncbi:MAG: transporter, periplasmic substrate-binding protein, partial [candidate division NC10 bacterium]|nr:transporter, periplasmic substrate-binding protein [candidate division NC10 bacterium]
MAMSREVRVGLFLVVAFLILIALFELLGKETIFARMVEYKTSFKSIPGLKLGDPVRLAGVDVGSVRDIQVIGARVEVTFRVKPGTPVKTDSIATIKLTSLLGTNFVDVTFGSPAAQLAPPGSLLQSAEPPDFNTLLARLNDAAGDIQTLAKQPRGEGTLGKLASDDGLYNDLRSLTADLKVASQGLSRIAKDVESGKGTLGKLVKDEALYNEAKSTLAQAKEALGGLQTMSRRITEGKGTLGRLLNDDGLYTDMQGAVASLNNIMKKVERGEGTLGKLLTDDSLYFTTKDNLKRVGKAADQLREQGPLSIIGIGIQAL